MKYSWLTFPTNIVFPLKHIKHPSVFDKLQHSASFKGFALNGLRSGICSSRGNGIREPMESDKEIENSSA